jgi:small subunit ribosomal protein S13
MSEGFRHIVRISGTAIDGSNKMTYGLAHIKGVGINFAKAIAKAAQLDENMRIGNISDDDIQKVESLLENPETGGIPGFLFNRRKDLDSGEDKHMHGSDLTLRQKMDIDFQRSVKSWIGVRHSFGLKVRGQRTRTCGRKGKAVGVKKKAIMAAVKEEKGG